MLTTYIIGSLALIVKPEIDRVSNWIKKPGVAIVSCNDGLRPVIMKLEATDEESKIDYEPVEW